MTSLVATALRRSARRSARLTSAENGLCCRLAFPLFSQLACKRRFASAPSRDADEDAELDISKFGNYNLVISDTPYALGVSHIKQASVPGHITRPPYVHNNSGSPPSYSDSDSRIVLGSEDEKKLRVACQLARRTLTFGHSILRPGITTAEIDSAIHDFIITRGAYPSPLGYRGYPKSCCTSVNNVLVHGIPDSRPLEAGDLVNIDITVYLDGFHGDCSETFPVGDVDQLGHDLISHSYLALSAGMAACGPGRPFKGIGDAIASAGKKHGFAINDAAAGHGIGRIFHCAPLIFHVANDEPGVMKPGHVFTVEPAIVQGDDARAWTLPDGWTMLTETGARAAQAEHTVLITETGVDILTKKDS